MNPKYNVLQTLPPLLPEFPTFVDARDLLIRDDNAKADGVKKNSETALTATSSPSLGGGQSSPRPDLAHQGGGRGSSDRGGRGRGGRGRGGHGRGGRHYNQGGGRGSPHQQWAPVPPFWPLAWNSNWRAPWTGATGPGVNNNNHPPSGFGQAYTAMAQPSTTPAPISPPVYDTSGLIQALHAASFHQPYQGGQDWYMDTGASAHMTGDPGILPKYSSSLVPNSSHVIVGNGSTIPILGSGSTTLLTPHNTSPYTMFYIHPI